MRLHPAAILVIAGLVCIAVSTFAALALAQQASCAPRADVLAYLERGYGETRVAAGLQDGGVIEVFATPDGATWTIIVTRPDGMACAVAAGEAWQAEAPQTPGRDG